MSVVGGWRRGGRSTVIRVSSYGKSWGVSRALKNQTSHQCALNYIFCKIISPTHISPRINRPADGDGGDIIQGEGEGLVVSEPTRSGGKTELPLLNKFPRFH